MAAIGYYELAKPPGAEHELRSDAGQTAGGNMNDERTPSRLLLGLAVLSGLCLLGLFLALHDVWHELGRPDYWSGQGPAAFEWRYLSVAFWPMLLFHLVFLASALRPLLPFGRRVEPASSR